jgi:hypothetical protein
MKPTTLCSNFVSPFHVSHHRDQHHAPGLSRGSSSVDLITGLRNNVAPHAGGEARRATLRRPVAVRLHAEPYERAASRQPIDLI